MMKTLSPAKINLFLEVGIQEKGFHNLISLVDIVNLCDIVEISESQSTQVNFYPGMDIPPENTVTKSIDFLKTLFKIKKDVNIKIFKNIPSGGGLGGGSSNAAAVLTSLIKLWNISVSDMELVDIAQKIGKDVPLFIYGKRCVMEGFGERIIPVSGKKPLAYCLMIPPFSVSTKEVYDYFDRLDEKSDLTGATEKIKLLNDSIEKKDISEMEKRMTNGLEKSYLSLWKEAKEVRDFLQAKTGRRVFVSGSGGTLYSVFPDKREAEEKKRFFNIEGWKSCVVESIRTS